jgi:hypothetical protein
MNGSRHHCTPAARGTVGNRLGRCSGRKARHEIRASNHCTQPALPAPSPCLPGIAQPSTSAPRCTVTQASPQQGPSPSPLVPKPATCPNVQQPHVSTHPPAPMMPMPTQTTSGPPTKNIFSKIFESLKIQILTCSDDDDVTLSVVVQVTKVTLRHGTRHLGFGGEGQGFEGQQRGSRRRAGCFVSGTKQGRAHSVRAIGSI